MKILITGCAGFIGYHLAGSLCSRGDEVVGIDNINDYYDVRVKYGRLGALGLDVGSIGAGLRASSTHRNLRFARLDLMDAAGLRQLFASERFDCVCNLAAQAGVRYSLTNPDAYIASNIQGFLNVLEACRAHPVRHLVYASSSSVYGLDTRMPFSESGAADHPASLYAASKRANELIAHSYSHLYGIPSTGLRFFTVYGPWGRPDMALFVFTKAILAGTPIDVYNRGEMSRDFTYVGDVVEGITRVLDSPPVGLASWDGRESAVSSAPYRVYNVGNGAPVRLLEFVRALEDALGRKAEINLLPMQPGDVGSTFADCSALEREMGYRPHTAVREGIARFVGWFREYHKL